jgi:hypothetical protein
MGTVGGKPKFIMHFFNLIQGSETKTSWHAGNLYKKTAFPVLGLPVPDLNNFLSQFVVEVHNYTNIMLQLHTQ